MFTQPGLTVFVLALPLLVAMAALLSFGNSSAPGGRQHALGLVLANALLTALVSLLIARQGDTEALTASQIILCSLAMLAAQIVAAPLLDRARRTGLLAASLLAALAIIQIAVGFLLPSLPELSRSGLVLIVILAASLVGLIGSSLLHAHPARLAHGDALRQRDIPQPLVLTGLVLLALCIGGLAWLLEPAENPLAQVPVVVSALVAALASLLAAQHARYPHPLRKAGEGLVAGTVIALLIPMDINLAVLTGALAAFGVARGELITHALRLDDPAHHVGTLLIPALLGLLLPGLLDMSQLAEQLTWLGAILALAGGISLVVWSAAMALFGLAAAPRRVREGLDFHC